MINYLAVLLAAIASMVLGSLWYSPLLFGNTWMKLMGLRKEGMKKQGMWKLYLVAFIGSLVTACVLAHLIDMLNIVSVSQALFIGFLVWLGFVATTTLSSLLWEGKPFSLYALNNGHTLLNLLVMSIIIVLL